MDISIKCDSLKAIYSVKNGMLRCVAPYEFTISLIMDLYEIPLLRFKTNGSSEREKIAGMLDKLVG